MNKEFIYKKIEKWSRDAGESFVDYFGSSIHEVTFMSWALGKGYIDSVKYNKWAESFKANKLEAQDPNYYLYDSDGGDVEFAVVISDDWDNDEEAKALMILSEFISEIEVYQSKLQEFLDD